jgi:hypothetical protein
MDEDQKLKWVSQSAPCRRSSSQRRIGSAGGEMVRLMIFYRLPGMPQVGLAFCVSQNCHVSVELAEFADAIKLLNFRPIPGNCGTIHIGRVQI